MIDNRNVIGEKGVGSKKKRARMKEEERKKRKCTILMSRRRRRRRRERERERLDRLSMPNLGGTFGLEFHLSPTCFFPHDQEKKYQIVFDAISSSLCVCARAREKERGKDCI